MQVIPADPLAYFENPDRKVQLNLRVPESLIERLDRLVLLWRELADDEASAERIDRTFVCVRLLMVGSDGAFGESVGGYPKTEEEFQAVLKQAAKTKLKFKKK